LFRNSFRSAADLLPTEIDSLTPNAPGGIRDPIPGEQSRDSQYVKSCFDIQARPTLVVGGLMMPS